MGHELACLLIDVVSVDQDLADVGLKVIADGANDQAAFLIDEEGAALALGSTFDRAPQLHQIAQVPAEFFGVATDGSGAGDQAHALRYVELVHDLA